MSYTTAALHLFSHSYITPQCQSYSVGPPSSLPEPLQVNQNRRCTYVSGCCGLPSACLEPDHVLDAGHGVLLYTHMIPWQTPGSQSKHIQSRSPPKAGILSCLSQVAQRLCSHRKSVCRHRLLRLYCETVKAAPEAAGNAGGAVSCSADSQPLLLCSLAFVFTLEGIVIGMLAHMFNDQLHQGAVSTCRLHEAHTAWHKATSISTGFHIARWHVTASGYKWFLLVHTAP